MKFWKDKGDYFKEVEKFIRKIIRVSIIISRSTAYLKIIRRALYNAKNSWVDFNNNYLFKLDI